MTDSFSSNGLQVSTQQELITALSNAYKEIYGTDIDLSQETPDGQTINIYAQGGTDVRSLLVQLYNSFDPDNAEGRILDQRCAINNVFRKGGTYTTVNIVITADRSVVLDGLDEQYNNPLASSYTIEDDAGNKFYLVNTQTLSVGQNTCLFRAADIGEVQPRLNSITNQSTVVLGVVSVNNPTQATIGQKEETDVELKIRRRKSVAIGSTGYIQGLLGALLQLDGVVDAAVYENYTGSTNSIGMLPHSIWVIVQGGSSEDIANAIYSKISPGCNMNGAISYEIYAPSKQQFIIKWDTPIIRTLYMKFTLQKLNPEINFNLDEIKSYILNNTSFEIGGYASTSDLTTIAQQAIDNNSGNTQGSTIEQTGSATNVLISTDNTNWQEIILSPAAYKFALTEIDITVQEAS